MRELSVSEKEVLSDIFIELRKCELFSGKYDAKNGSETFMFGILTALECLAGMVSDEFMENFSREFINNLIESEDKYGKGI